MATMLYRLGRFAFRRRGLVAVLWVVILAAVGGAAATTSWASSWMRARWSGPRKLSA